MSNDGETVQFDEITEEPFELSPKLVAAILFAVDAQNRDHLLELMEPLHAADIADILEQINTYDRAI